MMQWIVCVIDHIQIGFNFEEMSKSPTTSVCFGGGGDRNSVQATLRLTLSKLWPSSANIKVGDYDEDVDDYNERSSWLERNNVNEMQPKLDDHNPLSFERIRTIGTGTYGRVHLVRHRINLKYYALKIMIIESVVRNKQVDHVHNEKAVLQLMDHPFIVRIHCVFRNNKCLYMLLDYAAGGELFTYLREEHYFHEWVARFYAIEIILALDYMHNKKIVYRDLKPENILLDRRGHIKLTDMGFSKILAEPRTFTVCGTPEYIAPEVILGKGHNTAVDWWSLGILIYEMLAGKPPFCSDSPLEVYEKILHNQIIFPEKFPVTAQNLIQALLVSDRTRRLGNLKGKAEDIKNHDWFDEVVWDETHQSKLTPPIIPQITSPGDAHNFDSYEEIDFEQMSEATPDNLKLFDW